MPRTVKEVRGFIYANESPFLTVILRLYSLEHPHWHIWQWTVCQLDLQWQWEFPVSLSPGSNIVTSKLDSLFYLIQASLIPTSDSHTQGCSWKAGCPELQLHDPGKVVLVFHQWWGDVWMFSRYQRLSKGHQNKQRPQCLGIPILPVEKR